VDKTNREKEISIFPESHKTLSVSETKDALSLGIRTEERSIELYSRGLNKPILVQAKTCYELAILRKNIKKFLKMPCINLDQGGSWYGYSPPTLEG